MVSRLLKTYTAFMNSGWLSKLCFIIGCGVLMLTLTGCKGEMVGMLNPKGLIAYEERKLFFDTLALMLIVVLPVIIMSLTFIYHYQASHRITDYKPNWSHSYFLEALWWGIPCVIIFILGVMTWRSSHEMDPYARIPGHAEKPIVIQAIALPWKWLFIYPDQKIATVNYVEIPVGQQVEFIMTVDNVPMSAFFIPQLGSQIYAMAGMQTRLHLLANETGVFDGLNTQYNGAGFSDMHFEVHVVPPEEMTKWVANMKKSPNHLTEEAYQKLLAPTIGDKPVFYSGVVDDLFGDILHLYMHSLGSSHPRNDIPKYQHPTSE